MFKKDSNTKARQKWVKLKGIGLVSAILLVSFLGVSVNAEEVVTQTPSAETTYTVEPNVEQPVQGTETGNPATNLPATQPTPTDTQTQYVDNANTNTGSVPVAVDSSNLDAAVKDAEQAGVIVNETPGSTVTADTSQGVADAVNAAKADHNAQAKVIQDATNQYIKDVKDVNAQNQVITKQNEEATKDYEDKKQLADSVNDYVGSQAAQIPGSTVVDKVIDYTDPAAKGQVIKVDEDNKKTLEDYKVAVVQVNKDNEQIAKDNAAAQAKHKEQLDAATKLNDATDAYVAADPSIKTSLVTIDFTGENVPEEIKQLSLENDKKIAEWKKALEDAKNLYNTQKTSADSTNTSVDDALKTYPELKTVTEVIDYSQLDAVSKVEAIKAQNEKILAEYALALEKLAQENEAIRLRNEEVKKQEDEYNQRVVIAEDTKAGIKVTGQFQTDKRGIPFYSDIQVSYTGTDKTVKVADVIGWTANTVLKDAVGLTVYEYQDGGLTKGNPTEKTPGTAGIISTSTGKYRLDDVSVGDSFILTNMGTTSDGVNINMRLTVNNTLNEKNENLQQLIIGYDDMDGSGDPLDIQYLNYQRQGFDVEYIDDNGNPINLLTAFVIGDVDDGQSAQITFNGSEIPYVNPPGSLLTEGDNGLIHPPGVTSGFASAPNGTFLAVGLGTGLSYTHSSTLLKDGTLGVGQYYYLQYNLFGTSASVPVKTFVYETPKTIEAPTLTKVTLPEESLPEAPTLVKVNTPDKPTPTPPNDSVIVPHKHAIDSEGKVIDGSTVPRNSIVTYRAEMDNDQYKGMVIPLKSHKSLQAFVDDYDETAMTPILDKVVIQDAEGKPANVFTMYHVLNDTVLPAEVKEALIASGIKTNGAFILWVANDNESFINDYIVTGKDIIFYIPFQLNADFKGGEFTNEVHQVNFGNGYAGNVVILSTPEPQVPTPPAPPTPTPTPETPKEDVPPTPQAPVVEQAVLPKTGTKNSVVATIAGAILLVLTLGLVGYKRKEEK